MVLVAAEKGSAVVTRLAQKPSHTSSLCSGICCRLFEGRSSSAGKWGFSSGAGGLPRIRVAIYALEQQEKLLVFSRYLAKIPNSQNQF